MRPALPALVPSLVLSTALLAGCSSEPASDVAEQAPAPVSAPAAPSPSAAAPSTAPSVEAVETPSPADVAGPAPSATAGSPAASAAAPAQGGRPSSAAAAATATAAPARSSAAAVAAPASRATRAGRYTYDSRGTVTLGAGAPQSRSGSATLTIDPPEGDRQSGVLQGEQGRTETDSVLRADGRYLARLLLTTPAFSKEFAPAAPVLLLPDPLDVGRSWSFTLKSTDGKTTATAKNRVVRSEVVTVGGKRLDTRVVETVLTLRGDVVYDGTTTSNYAPEQRLAVRERGKGKGSVNSVPFSSDTSSSLRSVEPS